MFALLHPLFSIWRKALSEVLKPVCIPQVKSLHSCHRMWDSLDQMVTPTPQIDTSGFCFSHRQWINFNFSTGKLNLATYDKLWNSQMSVILDALVSVQQQKRPRMPSFSLRCFCKWAGLLCRSEAQLAGLNSYIKQLHYHVRAGICKRKDVASQLV